MPILSASDLASQGIYDLGALETLNASPPAWIVEGLIAAGSANIVVGDSGLGKTPLMLQLGLAVAAGDPFLNHATRACRVLYFDCESSRDSFGGIARSIALHLGQPHSPPNFFVYNPNWDERPERPEDPVLCLIQAIEALKPGLVIVDPLRIVWPRAEAKSEDAVSMVALQRRLARDFGVAFITVHHTRKPDREAPPINLASSPHEWLLDAAGSRALINQTDTRIGIARGHDLTLCGFTRVVGAITPMNIKRLLDDASGDPIAYALPMGTSTLSDSHKQLYLRLGPACTFTEMARIVHEQVGGEWDKAKGYHTDKALKALLQAGLLVSLGKSKGYMKVVTGAG